MEKSPRSRLLPVRAKSRPRPRTRSSRTLLSLTAAQTSKEAYPVAMAARHDANELDWDASLPACAVGGGERRGPSHLPLFPEMKINSKALPFVLAFAADKSAKSLMRLELLRAHPVPVPQQPPSNGRCVEKADPAVTTSGSHSQGTSPIPLGSMGRQE